MNETIEKSFTEAVEKAIAQLVADFQEQSTRFWNERDIHWYLFHHLKQDPVFMRDYGAELIRAEFPTRKVYTEEKEPARGHYDLVILDPVSLTNPPASELMPWASWGKFLPLVEVMIAIEVKTWVDRTTNISKKADWDIEKLTEAKNAVGHAYFLNFVQLDFKKKQMCDFYRDLRIYLTDRGKTYSNLRILCVPHNKEIQPDQRENWIQ
jgi:hypothetical protein